MQDQDFEVLKTKIQSAINRLDMLQSQYRELTGSRFVVSGPRPKIDSVHFHYTPAEKNWPREPDHPSEIEAEGDGVGGEAVAELINNNGWVNDIILEAFEEAHSKAAEENKAEFDDYLCHRRFDSLRKAPFAKR